MKTNLKVFIYIILTTKISHPYNSPPNLGGAGVVNKKMKYQEQIHNRKELKPFRKNLRNNSTAAEATLWNHIKGSQLNGKKFRRQHSVGFYILDFYCPSERLCIELDGAEHFTESGMAYDEERTAFLNNLNIKVLRFENKEIFGALESVLDRIKSSFTTPNPS